MKEWRKVVVEGNDGVDFGTCNLQGLGALS
jgi:hypothetical protein